MAKQALRKVAARVYKDPLRATVADIEKLAAGWLIEVDGKLPK